MSHDFAEKPLSPSVLPEPVPSDPDEPFFILSLTEIPLAEVVGGASEPLPCLADASKRQQKYAPTF